MEEGDDYVLDLCKKYDLANPDERYDAVPEIWNGHNVADFVDPDIMKKLDKLEKEEELREQAGVYDNDDVSYCCYSMNMDFIANNVNERWFTVVPGQ